MKITIVNGFFLPIPPVSGGATEKSWYQLAREFTAQGHQVTLISRRWPGFAPEETTGGIRHLRLAGFDHRRARWQNLLLDFLWSWRVFFALPPADIVIVNTVTLPIWLGRFKPAAGQVVILAGRMPKGQYRHYRSVARVLAPSSIVRDKLLRENRALAPVVQISGYPINWCLLNQSGHTATLFPADVIAETVCIGYIGRLHKEKGLRLLAAAVELLGAQRNLPPWRLLLCGPADVARGGSGDDFKAEIQERIGRVLPGNRFQMLDPQFNEKSLTGVFRRLDVFCYPSLATQGETFGVAVAEAMAAGAVPVVSRLACFTDFVHDGENGLTFDHATTESAHRLAETLERLIRDTPLRHRLAAAAVAAVERYDYPRYAATLLADFQQLTGSAKAPSSRP